MRELTLSDFAGTEGTAYPIKTDGSVVELVLEEAAPLPVSLRPGGSFRLGFRGPVQPILAQGIYALPVGGETVDIFIVPVGQDAAGTLYEAVFN